MSKKNLKFSLLPSFVLFVVHSFNLITDLSAVKFSFKLYPNGSFVWHGCLFKTADWLVPSNGTGCTRCIQNGTIMARNSDKYFMRYRNCSLECSQPTLCTEYQFNFNGTLRSECFVCEADTRENVLYKAVPYSELCGKDCASCAAGADLTSSTSCSSYCRGKPTFCPSHEPLFYGQRICYQSHKLHGCHYKKIETSELERRHGNLCVDCARHVGKKDAHICSHHCGNLPTWHKHVHTGVDAEFDSVHNVTSAVTQKEEIALMQCVLPKLGTVLDYEIPEKIRQFLNSPPNSSLEMLNAKNQDNKIKQVGSRI